MRWARAKQGGHGCEAPLVTLGLDDFNQDKDWLTQGHPTNSEKVMQLWGGMDGLTPLKRHHVHVAKQKPKFLCRTKQSGALGAILAQVQGHLEK